MRQTVSTIFLAPSAEQQLYGFAKPLQKLFVKRLHTLRISPRPPCATKLEGLDHLYRIREGDYRILYVIREKDLIVLAIKSAARAGCSKSPPSKVAADEGTGGVPFVTRPSRAAKTARFPSGLR